jgi:hypothetical protein
MAKFRKLPGFVSLITNGNDPVLKLVIVGKTVRLGATSLEILYDEAWERIKVANEAERLKKSTVPQGT